MKMICRLFATILVLVALTVSAGAVTVQGVNVPEQVQVDGKALRLQGAGMRKKLMVSVYVGALYLATPTRDAASAIHADEPKRISMVFVRDVDGSSLKEAYDEGFSKNAKGQVAALQPKIDTLMKLAAVDVTKGQEVSFTYLPGVGTQVAVGGAVKGTIEGHDFMEALWSVWLGDSPPTKDLKAAMLGLAKP